MTVKRQKTLVIWKIDVVQKLTLWTVVNMLLVFRRQPMSWNTWFEMSICIYWFIYKFNYLLHLRSMLYNKTIEYLLEMSFTRHFYWKQFLFFRTMSLFYIFQKFLSIQVGVIVFFLILHHFSTT